jgi:hypothetical protein
MKGLMVRDWGQEVFFVDLKTREGFAKGCKLKMGRVRSKSSRG